MKWFIALFLLLLSGASTFAQSVTQNPVEKWDLRKCVEYAMQNNISVRQADLQVRFAELDLFQSKQAQYGRANFTNSFGYGGGKNQDPTTVSLVNTGYIFNNMAFQGSIDLFNWFTKKNTIAANDLNLKATQAGIEKAKNDVALNVAVGYLQILLAREQITLAKAKVEQTILQLESTRKQVDAGKIPELNAVNLETLLAGDSSSLISAETAAQLSLLQMKALLNMDAAVSFDIFTPPVDLIPVESLADLNPDAVFKLAMTSMPQQKVDALKVLSAKKSVEVARGLMYPTFSLFGSLGTAFNSKLNEVKTVTKALPPIGTVTVSGTAYQVYPISPINTYTYGSVNFFNQFNQNFRQSLGVSANVQIFNGGNLRTAWQRSKLNVKQTELLQEQNSLTLKQDIYKAYNDAVAAVQKFNANKKTVVYSQTAYDFAIKRYELGLLSTYDLITTQATLQQAKSQLLYTQYDYVFKMKLLEFYKGQGLKL